MSPASYSGADLVCVCRDDFFFNREYKRLFGLPPKEHIKELKEEL